MTPLGRYVAAGVAVGLTLFVVGVIESRASLPTALLLYVLPVVLAATRLGRGPAILVSLLSVLGHDLLFVQPVGTLSVARADEAVGLVLLMFVAVVIAQLASAARRAGEKEQEASLARRSDAMKTALLRAVSHDLRTPLASIKASASGLRQADAVYTDEDRAELLAAIEDEADRLDRLVANLLEASRLEAGAATPHKEPQDLRELVRAVLSRLQPMLADRPVRLTLPDELPLVACNYAQIDHVLTNLLENAARHTPPGTPIDLSVALEPDAVRVQVADAGPGIAPTDRERVFFPFERGPTRVGGSGLGLAIARGLVQAHDGRLWVDQAALGGARFNFTLPVDGARA
ncbi:MAG: PAS domain-containing sensor histidine kinase [Chloroflexota bacterium]|nr:PAS domain-containing sensor histidine kinase [Chloroflexota bacterium]